MQVGTVIDVDWTFNQWDLGKVNRAGGLWIDDSLIHQYSHSDLQSDTYFNHALVPSSFETVVG